MPRDILSVNDVHTERATRAPQRELSFYGSIRRGWHKVLEGLEEIDDVCDQLSASDGDNVRMQRYCVAIKKLYEQAHKLHSKASRVRVNTNGEGGE